mmetsp:Transcript_35908/g.78931  ORF Transcript_35908/g.78931 Transcript_35908/m.78931 type:complete len:105 (-) Transcript_35908:819-1133(-)
MEGLGFVNCDPRARRAGNRPRVTWTHLRADDAEGLRSLLTAHDLLLLAAEGRRLDDEGEESARFCMQRKVLGFLSSSLRERGKVLRRDRSQPLLRWAWLQEGRS